MTYAAQYLRTIEGERRSSMAGARTRQKVALLCMVVLSRFFEKRRPPVTVGDLSGILGAPARLIEEAFIALCKSGLAVKAEHEEDDAYVLAGPPEEVRIMDVFDAMAGYGARTTAR